MSDFYDPLSVSDNEAANLYSKEMGQKWLTTAEGKQFDKHYNTPSNREKLAEVFNLLDEALTLENLSAAFRRLVESGALRTPEEIREAAEQAEEQRSAANKAKYDKDCSAWVDSHSTQQIKERAQSDRPFASWLRSRNVPPVMPVEYHPTQIARQRKEIAAAKAKSQPDYSDPKLVEFATRYKRMPFAELKTQMNNRIFREQVQRASAAQLI